MFCLVTNNETVRHVRIFCWEGDAEPFPGGGMQGWLQDSVKRGKFFFVLTDEVMHSRVVQMK